MKPSISDSNYDSNHPVYVPIDKYRIVDESSNNCSNDAFDTKTLDVLEISATEVTVTTESNNNTQIELVGRIPISNDLSKNVEFNVLFLLFLLFLDTMTLFKYLYIPIVLYNFFGPIWIIVPWTLAATINYLLQMILLYYGEHGRNLYLPSFKTLANIRSHNRAILISDEDNLESNNINNNSINNNSINNNNIDNNSINNNSINNNNIDNNSINNNDIDNNNINNDRIINNNIDTNNINNNDTTFAEVELINSVFLPKKRIVYLLTVWSVIDSIISIISATIGVFIILFICQDVDGITTGYLLYFRILLSGIAFSLCSLFIRGILILFPCLCCACNIYSCFSNFNRLGITRANLQISALGNKYIDNCCKFIFIMSFIMFWVALGFTLAGVIVFLRPLTKNVNIDFYNCDPMVPLVCSLPFPSSYNLQVDSTTSTGYRVNVGPSTLPYHKKGLNGHHINPQYLNEFDGFSVSAGILWHLPGILDKDLISYEFISKSTLVNSTTLLIDKELNILFSHFTERDYSNTGKDKIFYIQPAKSLKFSTQYIVVVKGFKNSKGNLLEPSSVTKGYITAYKNQASMDDPRYTRLLSTLSYLDSQSIDLDSIQLIWDFHTASEESLLGMAKTITRNVNTKMSNILSTGQKPYKATYQGEGSNCRNYIDSGAAELRTILYFDISVPWLLQSDSRLKNTFNKELLNPSSIDKIPMRGSVKLEICVPCSVYLGLEPSAVVQYGHGIFGSKSDVDALWLRSEASAYGWILWSMDWRGWDIFDLPLLVKTLLHDVDLVNDMRDATIQGYVNKLAGKSLIYNILDDFKVNLGLNVSTNFVKARSYIPMRYIGNSMGSILGSGFVALANYSRAIFLVPGSPFSFVAQRSSLFSLYELLLKYQFYNQIDSRIILNSWQILLDAAESSGWANTNVYDTIDILAEIGLGDTTVTNIAGHIFSRNMKLNLMTPTVFDVYDMNSTTTLFGNKHHALYQGYYPSDEAMVPSDSTIPKPTNVHGCLPSNPKIMQLTSYFTTYGTVFNPCASKVCVLSETPVNC